MDLELDLLRKRVEKLSYEVEVWKERYEHLKSALFPTLIMHEKYGFTDTETAILGFFVSNKGVFRKNLYTCFHLEKDNIPDVKGMDTYICKIRAKIRKYELPINITTIRGVGWAIDKEGIEFIKSHIMKPDIEVKNVG